MNYGVWVRTAGVQKLIPRFFENNINRFKAKRFSQVSYTLPFRKAKYLTKGNIHCQIAVEHFRICVLFNRACVRKNGSAICVEQVKENMFMCTTKSGQD